MSFAIGVSGLNAAAKALDVVGNNISNANTIGFKTAQAQFADVFAATVSNAAGAAKSAGLGIGTSAVVQSFRQGNVLGTNNPLDVAITGKGFFRLNDAGSIAYTRNGQFHLVGELDSTPGTHTQAQLASQRALLVSADGVRVTGYQAEYTTDPAGTISANASPADIVIEPSMPAAASKRAALGVNVDASAKATVDALGNLLPFVATDPATFNHSTSITTYTADGASHDLSLYFAKTAPNTWQIYSTLDGVQQAGSSAMTFDAYGNLATGSTLATGGISIDLTGSTQYDGSFSSNSLTQDGYGVGSLTGLAVDSDGVIQASFSNGRTRKAAQIALAGFTNPDGLTSLGNNRWAATAASGAENVGKPGSASSTTASGLGVLTGAAVEEANVDLSVEMVSLITQQRYYQANAQSIKTQDQVLQTLAGIR